MEPDFLAQRPFEDDLLLSRMDTESDGKGDGNGSPSGPGGPGATTGEGSNGDGEDGEPQGPQSHRDLQRWALQELVTLTTQCANQETRVAVQLQKSTAENNTKAQRGHADLERNYKGLQDQIAQKYEERQKEIDSRYRQVAQVLKERDEETKSRAATESERAQRDIKQSYEQAVWLSESVQEAAEGKAAEDLKKANETFLNQKEYLEGKEKDAQSLLERYGQPAPPGEPLATIKAAEETEDPIASFARHRDTIEEQLKKLAALTVPNLLVGARPYLAVFLLLIVAVVAPQAIKQTMQPQLMELGISLGAAGILATVGILVMRSMAKKQVATTFVPLRRALDAARIGNDNMLARAKDQQSMEVSKARRQQKAEALLARDKAAPALERAKQKKEKTLQTAKTTLTTKTSENEQQRDSGLKEVEEWRENKTAEVKQRYEAEFAKIDQRAAERKAAIQKQFAADRAALEKKWKDGLAHIQEPIQEGENKVVPWNDPSWNAWKPPTKFPATVPFGQMKIDLKTIVADVAKDNPFTLPLPETFMVPALFAFPRQASMLIHTDRVGRAPSIAAMQMMMARLLTCLPPGRVRFTLIDPVGLGQNFSGFMHLADYDEALVGGRIWTEEDQINQRLENLTEHMETVIQKYLRNEFATIDDYNAQAGELAEPYRFLIVSDFPQNFSDEAFRRLSSIATTGSRCGVYTLIMRDTRINSSGGSTSVEDVQAHSINLAFEDGRFVWRDEVFRRFPLTLDAPPEEDELTKIMHQVGKRAREANRVEVPFDTIAPKPEQFWTQKSASDLQVAIGRCGATRLQSFRLGKGVAQHALVAGKTGSGKSTMLHALIANLAMWYSPEEVELYLIDFKKGVEFKTYAAHMLPHARAIAVESDREFGLSVLQRIDAELARRGELFRKAEVQDLASYRAATNTKMPRTLLIIDEFQEFFSDDDKLAQDASGLLDRLVRQGRAFGIHVLLGSQTIGGSSGLSRSTIGQIAVRIALQTSEADSQMILGDGNSAARLLSRPGEAIYNDAGGLVEGNSPFQVAWLPDERRDVYLDAVNEKVQVTGISAPLPIVFEGNAPADYRRNHLLTGMLKSSKYAAAGGSPVAWLGDPVAIKNPTAIAFRRQSGANVLMIGQNEEAALAMMGQSMIGLASQLPPSAASFVLLDGSPTDSPSFGALGKAAAALPNETKNIEYRAVPAAIHELAVEMEKRREEDASNPPAIFVFIFNMQRFRALRKAEESFTFSSGDEEKPPDTGKEFADLLREGPGVGIHVIAWVDTTTALDRTLDRGSMREFDNRILFQMSASDSSNLIDSPAANKLGSNRALAYSEEQGSMEKFRPYAPPDKEWLAEVKGALGAKAKGA